jgi:guanosine-3',5'-bis(diphosphate) 3'-pyrophosphohydrolase
MSTKPSAEAFAIAAHGDQKYGDQPYVVHLRHVQKVLSEWGFANDPILVNAAWLHDVAEDTSTPLSEIEANFGTEVADIVQRVTDEPGSDRKERKLKTYPKIKGHRGATIVKLCDRIANVEASKAVAKKFAMYRAEYPDFKDHLFVPGIADSLWTRLDDLLLKIRKSTWANGQPAIELNQYEHSKSGAAWLLEKIARVHGIPQPAIENLGPEAIPEIATYISDFTLGNEKVSLHMDEYFCSVGFQSESLRDQTFAKLACLAEFS